MPWNRVNFIVKRCDLFFNDSYNWWFRIVRSTMQFHVILGWDEKYWFLRILTKWRGNDLICVILLVFLSFACIMIDFNKNIYRLTKSKYIRNTGCQVIVLQWVVSCNIFFCRIYIIYLFHTNFFKILESSFLPLWIFAFFNSFKGGN